MKRYFVKKSFEYYGLGVLEENTELTCKNGRLSYGKVDIIGIDTQFARDYIIER